MSEYLEQQKNTFAQPKLKKIDLEKTRAAQLKEFEHIVNSNPMQRFAKEEGEEKQMKPREGEELQIKSGSGTEENSTNMPEDVKTKMENSFGTDFGDVNIHQNSSRAKSIKAQAFTLGNEIHFAPGFFNPASPKGQKLLAHELTHIVQQRHGKAAGFQQQGNNINNDPNLEAEADNMAQKVSTGVGYGNKISGVQPSIQKNGDDEEFFCPISDSVGKDGANKLFDVLYVGASLFLLGYTEVLQGEQGLIQAIERFQSEKCNFNNPDGHIELDQTTIKTLSKSIGEALIDVYYTNLAQSANDSLCSTPVNSIGLLLTLLELEKDNSKIKSFMDKYKELFDISIVNDINEKVPEYSLFGQTLDSEYFLSLLNWDKNVFDEDARNDAVDFINDNEKAYLQGDESWKNGSFDGGSYNNILIVDKSETSSEDNHLKVFRSFSDGVYTLIGTETLTDAEYETEVEESDYSNTYCNIAATKIGLSYGAPNLQNHEGSEHNANSMYDNFEDGFYDTDTHEFINVDFDEAEEYAANGGLAYAVWKNGIGHIATLIGGYGNDGEETMANLKIFQAGGTFGEMNYEDGFGTKESKFYIWQKK